MEAARLRAVARPPFAAAARLGPLRGVDLRAVAFLRVVVGFRVVRFAVDVAFLAVVGCFLAAVAFFFFVVVFFVVVVFFAVFFAGLRPLPDSFPPPSCLLTVAHAIAFARLLERPCCFSLLSMCAAWRFCLVV